MSNGRIVAAIRILTNDSSRNLEALVCIRFDLSLLARIQEALIVKLVGAFLLLIFLLSMASFLALIVLATLEAGVRFRDFGYLGAASGLRRLPRFRIGLIT